MTRKGRIRIRDKHPGSATLLPIQVNKIVKQSLNLLDKITYRTQTDLTITNKEKKKNRYR
jgi:hypothetical protein